MSKHLKQILNKFIWRSKNEALPSEKKSHVFSSDRPIRSSKQDLLNRKPFADKVAEGISSWREDDSLVVAIFGKWGSGKTSVKNLVIEKLEAIPEKNRPRVVEFNPWECSDQKHLMAVFFKQIHGKLGRIDKETRTTHLARLWNEYAQYIQLGNDVLGELSKAARWTIGILAGGSFLIGMLIPEKAQLLLLVASGVILALALIGSFASNIVKPIARLFEIRDQRQKRSLSEIKKELSDELKAAPQQILVIIDDVDRLNQEEVRTLFQIIKVNCDFPNLAYLLFFDREKVESCIEDKGVFKGKDYLEKIVQVAFDLPKVNAEEVRSILCKGLDDLLRSTKSEFDEQRWASLFVPGISAYFENLRDVNRFLSAFTFQVGIWNKPGALDINFIDLIGLEVLRQFESKVYHAISSKKHLLTSNPPSGASDKRTEEWKTEIVGLVQMVEPENRGAIQAILVCLFPNVRWCFEKWNYSVGAEEFRAVRVCHHQIFDRYFLLQLPGGDVSTQDFLIVLERSGDANSLKEHFRDLLSRNILSTFLRGFQAYRDEIPYENLETYVTSLFDIADTTSFGRQGMLEPSDMTLAKFLVDSALEKEPDVLKRRTLLLSALKATSGTTLPLDFIATDLDKLKKGSQETAPLMTSDLIPALEECGRQIIDRKLKDADILSFGWLSHVLWSWTVVKGDDEVRQWLSQNTKDAKALLLLLSRFVQKTFSTSAGDYTTKVTKVMAMQSLKIYMDIEQVHGRISALALNQLTPQELETVQIFNASYATFKNQGVGYRGP